MRHLTVLLNDVDALDIDLLEVLLVALQRECRKEHHTTNQRGSKCINLQEPYFFFQFVLLDGFLFMKDDVSRYLGC